MKVLQKCISKICIAQEILFIEACPQQHQEVSPGRIWWGHQQKWRVTEQHPEDNSMNEQMSGSTAMDYLQRLGVAITCIFTTREVAGVADFASGEVKELDD